MINTKRLSLSHVGFAVDNGAMFYTYGENITMALAHTLGFPRIGADRELKKALEAYWKGDLDQDGLKSVGRQLRATHWQLQKDAGIDLLPVGDFAWYDQVLTHSLTFGVIPERFDSAKDARRPADPRHPVRHGPRRYREPAAAANMPRRNTPRN